MRDALLRVRRHRLGTDECSREANVRTRCCASTDTEDNNNKIKDKTQ